MRNGRGKEEEERIGIEVVLVSHTAQLAEGGGGEGRGVRGSGSDPSGLAVHWPSSCCAVPVVTAAGQADGGWAISSRSGDDDEMR